MLHPLAHLNCSEPVFHPTEQNSEQRKLSGIFLNASKSFVFNNQKRLIKKKKDMLLNTITDQVQDQREFRRAACLQWQGWLSGELLLCQWRDMLDEEIPTNEKITGEYVNTRTRDQCQESNHRD